MTNSLTVVDWNMLRAQVDWTHSFVREFYFVSHRYFEKDDVDLVEYHPDSPFATVRIIWAVVGRDPHFAMCGLEFNLLDAKSFVFQSVDDAPPIVEHDATSGTPWSLQIPSIGFSCKSRKIKYSELGNEYLGPHLRLGYEAPNDDYFEATSIEGRWRQCSNCSNAWEEFDSVAYARCPSCGVLTLLEHPNN